MPVEGIEPTLESPRTGFLVPGVYFLIDAGRITCGGIVGPRVEISASPGREIRDVPDRLPLRPDVALAIQRESLSACVILSWSRDNSISLLSFCLLSF